MTVGELKAILATLPVIANISTEVTGSYLYYVTDDLGNPRGSVAQGVIEGCIHAAGFDRNTDAPGFSRFTLELSGNPDNDVMLDFIWGDLTYFHFDGLDKDIPVYVTGVLEGYDYTLPLDVGSISFSLHKEGDGPLEGAMILDLGCIDLTVLQENTEQ